MSSRSAAISFLAALLSTSLSPAAGVAEAGAMDRRAPNRAEALRRGVDYLLKSQNRDGSWGSGASGRSVEVLAAVPGAHDAFRVGSTALCWMALGAIRSADETVPAARARAFEFLLAEHRVRRPNSLELYNVWSFAYSLQAFARALGDVKDAASERRLREASSALVKALALYQVPDGGWGYYDFLAGTYRPSDSSMSFTTATVLLALREARERGVEVPAGMAERALRSLRSARKDDGAYIYGFYARFDPQAGYNQLKGSLGRTQACNLALRLYGVGAGGTEVSDADLRRGLEAMVREHRFLDIGRKRPFPHEAWYFNSGYYFYYGHYYASVVLHLLPAADQTRIGARIERIVLERQEADGSWWDFPLYSYHKAYGTAFAILALTRDGVRADF